MDQKKDEIIRKANDDNRSFLGASSLEKEGAQTGTATSSFPNRKTVDKQIGSVL
jgi:hypothetical protein